MIVGRGGSRRISPSCRSWCGRDRNKGPPRWRQSCRLWIINPDGKEILRDGRNRTTIDSFRLVRGSGGSALSRDGNALQSEAASSIGSGISIVGKIIGNGALTIFGHVEGEVRASTIVIAEGAQIEGKVSAEELTVGGYVKGTRRAK